MTIDTHKEKETKLKLKLIGDDFKKLMKVYPPSVVVIEQGFTRFNASTQAIFRVHGLVNYLFCDYEQIYYPSTTVKKVVGGKGNMSKEELQKSIIEENSRVDFDNYDESDAYAVGLTYFATETQKECQNFFKTDYVRRINKTNITSKYRFDGAIFKRQSNSYK